jgi:hypothetical protein
VFLAEELVEIERVGFLDSLVGLSRAELASEERLKAEDMRCPLLDEGRSSSEKVPDWTILLGIDVAFR